MELTLNPQPTLAIPAVQFNETSHPCDKLIDHDIYITPSDEFSIEFRDIFSSNIIRHNNVKESHIWLKPNMSYWSQQLNFALWCATIGCGISIRSLFDDGMTDS